MNRLTRRGVTLVALVIAPPAGATPILLASASDAPNGAAVTPYTNSFNLTYWTFAIPYVCWLMVSGSSPRATPPTQRVTSATPTPPSSPHPGTGVTDTLISAAVAEPARLTMMGLGFAALVARQAR